MLKKKYSFHNFVRYTGFILLACWLLFGFLNYKDYGVGWDEEAQRQVGQMAYDYAFAGDKAFETFIIREHGAVYEMFLVAIEKATGLTEKRDIYFQRHLINHLTFLLGAWFLFLLADHIYRNKFIAATGFLLIVLHPVLYAQSFFNSKDLPFLSVMMIAIYFFVRSYETGKLKHIILLGILSGILIAIRLTGLVFVAISGIFLLSGLFRKSDRKRIVVNCFVYGAITIATLWLTWPLLWKDPVSNFLWVFSVMAKYPFDGVLLFQGEMINGPNLPWYYVPVWFSISTPLPYLVAGFISVILILAAFLKWKTNQVKHNLLLYNLFFLSLFLLPVVIIILLHSVVYDGWRHMFFIYPPFALLSLFVLHYLQESRFKKITAIVPLVLFVPTVVFMINNHPLQFVHFNLLADTKTPEYLRHRYELDYWGVAYKQGLETILKYDTSAHIRISSQNPPCDMNLELFTKEQRERFSFVVIAESDYFLTNYRWHPEDYTEPELRGKEWKSVTVQNNSVNMIYKLKK